MSTKAMSYGACRLARPATRLRSSTTDSDTTAVAATSSYAAYAKLYDTDPATSAAWTVANLNAAEVGMLESVAGNRLTGAFILFDASPPVATFGWECVQSAEGGEKTRMIPY